MPVTVGGSRSRNIGASWVRQSVQVTAPTIKPARQIILLPAPEVVAPTTDIVGTATLGIAPTGAVTGIGQIAGSAALALTPTGAVVGRGAVSGATGVTLAPTGTVNGVGALSGSAALAIAPSGAVNGTGALSGAAATSLVPSGAVSGAGALAGSAALGFDASATLAGTAEIAGSAGLFFEATGTLENIAAPSTALHGRPKRRIRGRPIVWEEPEAVVELAEPVARIAKPPRVGPDLADFAAVHTRKRWDSKVERTARTRLVAEATTQIIDDRAEQQRRLREEDELMLLAA